MKCVHCRKEISFAASICPWCHRETRTSQTYQVFGAGFSVGLGIVGAAIGYFVAEIGGSVVGLLIGMAVGAVVGVVLAGSALKRGPSR